MLWLAQNQSSWPGMYVDMCIHTYMYTQVCVCACVCVHVCVYHTFTLARVCVCVCVRVSCLKGCASKKAVVSVCIACTNIHTLNDKHRHAPARVCTHAVVGAQSVTFVGHVSKCIHTSRLLRCYI